MSAPPNRSLLPALRKWLSSAGASWWCAALAVLLTSPSLASGLLLDDHVHRIVLDPLLRLPGMVGSPFNVFVFVSADPASRALLAEEAHGAWWAAPDLVLAFFRPLASLSHWFDYRFLPGHPALMHAENLLWLAALVLAAAAIYRRLMAPAWVAGLATLLFAVDDAHGLPAGWIANRNGLMAAAFGAWTLVAHDRWRRSGWKTGAAVGPILFVLGLLSAEAGLASLGYLAAHAVFLERGPWKRRAAALAPYAVLTVVYRVAYSHYGYGARWSEFYIDPVANPVRFALAAAERIPILLLGQLGVPSSDVGVLLLNHRFAFVAFATAFLGFVASMLAPRLRRDPTARFWAAGLVLSVIPACATFPNDRLLLLPGVGGMALVADFLGEMADSREPEGRASRPARALCVLWIAVHGVLAPLTLPLRALAPRLLAGIVERAADSAPRDEALRGKTLVVANAPDLMVATYLRVRMVSEHRPSPATYRCLGATFARVDVSRPDDRTLVLRAEGGYLTGPLDRLVRSADVPFHPGDQVRLAGLTIDVTQVTGDGRPAEVAYRFDVPLEDASLRWVTWKRAAFVPFEPPPVGGTTVLEATDVMEML